MTAQCEDRHIQLLWEQKTYNPVLNSMLGSGRFRCRTPNQLKQEVLIQKAINLLENTTATVERISEGLGFSSTNYFRKVFKEHTGTSPRQYRKNAAIR